MAVKATGRKSDLHSHTGCVVPEKKKFVRTRLSALAEQW